MSDKENNQQAFDCTIYKSVVKDETYVYLESSGDINDLPKDLLKVLGSIEKVMDIMITPEKKLARYLGQEIIDSINSQGFHLQMPENPQLKAIRDYKRDITEELPGNKQ